MNQNQIINSKIVKESKEMTKPQTDSLHAKFVYRLLPSNEKINKDFYYQQVAFVYYFKNKVVVYFNIPEYGNVIDLFFVNNNTDQKDAVSIYRCSFAEADRKQLKYICDDLNLQCCK